MRGQVHNKRRGEQVERAELPPILEPLQPPEPFAITGPLSEIECAATKAVLTELIAELVATGRATDETT